MSEVIRCLDKEHEPPFSSSWETKWWCPNAVSLHGTKMSSKYFDGRSINWLRLCEKSGKVVVHNKKCDCRVSEEKGDSENAEHSD